MGALDSTRGGLGGHDYGAGAISRGAIPRPGMTGPRALFLRSPRSYRGRVGAAIPTGGIQLPAGGGGTAPYTYSISNLPAGLSFAAGTQIVTGSPTTPYASREVTYTITDSATPAATASRMFQFPVVDSGDEVTLEDWDNRGYGLATLQPVFLALFESDTDVAGTEGTVAIFARQNRGNAGFLLDADGAVTTDLSSLVLPGDGATPILNWIRAHPSNGRFTLNHGTMDALGQTVPAYAFSDHFPDGSTCYVQDKGGVVAIPRDNAGGGFIRFRPTAGQNEVASEALQARLDTGVHFIVALTVP